jgi:alpha,alpha-trehalase
LNDKVASRKYSLLASTRKNAINTYCWNDKSQFYYDYDYVEKKLKQALTLAASYPLFFNVAGKEAAQQVADNLKKYFLVPGGLQTTTTTTNHNGIHQMAGLPCNGLPWKA